MKELDFLPQSFHGAIRRRRRSRRNWVYSLAVVTGLAVLCGLTRSEIRSAEAALATFREGAGLRGTQRARLIALKQVRANLQVKADLISRLEDDAPVDAIVAEISRFMSPGMALRSFGIRPSAAGEPAAPTGPQAGATRTTNKRLQAVLQGVAPNDVEVGAFFGRLSGCPLLDEVRLSYSREARQSGRLMREFELTFAVRRVALSGGEVSSAGPQSRIGGPEVAGR